LFNADTDGNNGISGIVKVVDGKSHLFQIIGALHPSCCLTGCLHGGQKKSDQHSDNRDDNEQFDEGEAKTYPNPPPPPYFNILDGHVTSPNMRILMFLKLY
jgi:hypothetical protein